MADISRADLLGVRRWARGGLCGRVELLALGGHIDPNGQETVRLRYGRPPTSAIAANTRPVQVS